MKKYKTEQEKFWAGKFGNTYIRRNNNPKIVATNIRIFSDILRCTRNVNTVIEFGANIGLNLLAIKSVLPHVKISAIEINKKAVQGLHKTLKAKIYHKSIFDFVPDFQRDFVLIKEVLIHINPDLLPLVYDLLYKTSKKYICIAEYYNPTPVAVEYRGEKDKLFKRDFAGEMLDKYKKLRLVSYGFTYHRDNYNEYDDLNWFLLEKLT